MDVSARTDIFDRILDFSWDIHLFFDPGIKKFMDVWAKTAVLGQMEAGGHPALRVNQEMKETKSLWYYCNKRKEIRKNQILTM